MASITIPPGLMLERILSMEIVRVTERANATRRHTRSIIVLPASETSGLPGRRLEA